MLLRKFLVTIGMLALAMAAEAQTLPSTPVSLNIPKQALGDALNEFARQAKLHVAFYSTESEGLTSPPLAGSFTPHEALTKLLSNTSLTYSVIDAGTVAVMSKEKAAEKNRGARAGNVRISLASVDTRAGDPAAEESMPLAQSEDAATKGVPEMLVKGKRSANSDIERTRDDVQPYVVFDSKTIERSMATNLDQFLKSRLPQNQQFFSNNQDATGPYGNQSKIDLRGLGADQTLILINGRRAPSISLQTLGGSFGQPDLNGIPISSVERIEILPSTASGIYGGGATGGVINVVLKRTYSGFEVKGRYENAFDTDIAQRNLETNAGFTLEGGKTAIMLAGSFSDANELLMGERDFFQRSRDLLSRNNPTWYLFESSPPAGYTTNISTEFGEDLVLDNGTVLNSSITHVPVGYAGVASDGGRGLINNVGSYNLDLSNDLNGAGMSLVSHPRMEAYSANIRREFGSRVEAFIDLARYRNISRTANGESLPFVSLAADAPNNPFDQDVLVTIPTPNLSSIATSLSQTTQAAAGVIVRLPRNWSTQLDYSWSESRNSFRTGSPLVSDAVVDLISSGEFDVTRDLNMNPLDFSPYRLQNPNVISGPADTALSDFAMRVAGPLFELPGGAMTVTASVGRREQEAEHTWQTRPSFGDSSVVATAYYPARRQDVDSAYLETLLPLVGAKNPIAGIHSLEVQVSARRDKYSTDTVPSGTLPVDAHGQVPDQSSIVRTITEAASTDYTVGLRYAPIEDVALRASYGTGFLPAGIHQLTGFDTIGRARITVTDPRRNNQRYTNAGVVSPNPALNNPVTVRRGGNANLAPEQSESVSLGIILTPHVLPGLRLSVDYTQIEKSDEMRSLNEQLSVENEALLGDRIRRETLRPQDQALGYTVGRINYLDLTLLNIATTKIKAYDFQADYIWETGRGEFNAYALMTWQPHFKRQLSPVSPVVETAGYLGTSALEWRGNAGINWQRGSWTLGWNAQFIDSYYVYGPDATLAARNAAATNQGSATIPHQVYHDLLAEYRFGQRDALGGLLSNTEITFGIQNVLDTMPAIMASTWDYGIYSYYGDPRMRRYSIALRKAF